MRIFSGIRPTGELHLGNYIGAIRQWISLQENNECIFCIVDLHAITTPYNREKLQEIILNQAIAYLSLGLDPQKCALVVQSHIKEHTELTWILGTITPLGELQRMTQFKEKSKKHKEYINAGLLNYPILMSADILLYQSEVVPVGEDQKQHVELARTIAKKFNSHFGETFKIPEAKLAKNGAKIMSLQDPRKKMSKTGSAQGCIELFEDPESIRKKIMSAVTDTEKTVKYNQTKKPGISNLLTIYSSFKSCTIKEAEKEFENKNYAEFKTKVANLVVEYLEPFRRKKKELESREIYVWEILNQGARRAETIAQTTMIDVKKKTGLTK
ncbi:MAG: tryptophan--tRNA ligase [Candidatus Nealsonbacteria bacterium]|nr:tryptophan--tRNA ligase [Candidatus Nealsonbacteria bacterium]